MTSPSVTGALWPAENIEHTHATGVVEGGVWYNYMDNLRALALLLGVFFHAALAYSPLMHNFWLTADVENSAAQDVLAWFSHLFRMPLFFLISGFFAAMLLQKRGWQGFLKNRAARILFPFLVFLLPVMAAVISGMIWATNHIENLSPALQFIKLSMGNPDAPEPPFSTMHLWFLFNLFLFCCLAVLLWKLRFFESKLANLMSSPWFLMIILPLLMIPALASQSAPLPAPEKIYPELWSFGSFGLMFLAGLLIYRRQRVLLQLKRFAPLLFVASITLYAYYYSQLSARQVMATVLAGGYSFQWANLPMAAIEAFVAVWMTLFCLVIGKLFLDRKNTVLRVFAESSYWVYLIHLPVLFFIQYLLLDVQMNMWLKFLVGSFSTLGIGIISYYLLVKWTPLGWLLAGRRAQLSQP